MRICYYADGRYIHARRWMRYFAERGHEMHLISMAEMSVDDIRPFEGIGVKVHGWTGPVHVKKFWRTLADLRFVRSVLKQEKIDVLHCHFLGANAWYAALSGFHPYVITIMGGGDVTGPNWRPNTNLQARLLTPFTLRHADFITSWSKQMANVVRPYARSPIEVIHGGIHLDSFSPGNKPANILDQRKIPADAKVVFSPRLMRPLSNIMEIALAADLVSRVIPDVYFVVAFPRTEVDVEYSLMVRQKFFETAGQNVAFVSEISHTEMADYHRLADVTVSIPSTDGTPMTVLESMACGTPTVIGELPDYDREYFENEKTTLMVDVKDPKAIADAVIRYLSDSELRQRIATEARRRVLETGGYEYQMSKMEKIYESLVQG